MNDGSALPFQTLNLTGRTGPASKLKLSCSGTSLVIQASGSILRRPSQTAPVYSRSGAMKATGFSTSFVERDGNCGTAKYSCRPGPADVCPWISFEPNEQLPRPQLPLPLLPPRLPLPWRFLADPD